ncbi:MAG: aminotransferase class III-fold pyridoxal phosphate-dependent enzyme, partial [Nitrosotalea sp.]
MVLQLKKSLDLLSRAKKVLPAQTHTFSKGYKSFVEGVYPIFAQRGKGSHIFDVDGNDFIDYMAALGPIILGYSYDVVNESIKKQLADGSIFSLPHPLEVEAAELMCHIIPGCDMAKFTKTGSDAVTAAVRGAKAITGKDHVAYWGGGGVWHDWFTVITSRNRGVPKSLKNMIKLFEYNKIESLKKVLDNDKEIGTVCMEPMTFEKPDKNFLQDVKRITHEHDAILVFDEVQTGFRWALGGAQEYFGVQADISAWGKAMANGMPLGAISGKSEFMKIFDEVFYSTTFGGETLSLAAFQATVKEMQEKKVIEHIFKMGTKFYEGFTKIVQKSGANVTIEGFPCKLKLGFPDKNGNDSLLIRSLFCQENIERGILFWQGPVFHT